MGNQAAVTFDVDDLGRRVREAVAFQRSRVASRREVAPEMRLPRLPPSFRPPASKWKYSVDELLSYHDRFAKRAFSVLSRSGAPSPSTFPIDASGPTTAVPAGLRFSRANLVRALKAAGLVERRVAHKVLGLPGVKHAASTAVNLARLSRRLLRLEQQQNHAQRELDVLRVFLNELTEAIEQGGSELMHRELERVFLIANQRLLAVQHALTRIDGLENKTNTELPELSRQLKELARQLEYVTRANAAIERRVDESGIAAGPDSLAATPNPSSLRLEALYAALEDRFRGTGEEISARASYYLPIVRHVHAGVEDRPVIDVGCGRGEWVALLKDNHLTAKGVDSNGTMVAQCKERGLEAIHADGIEYLRGLPEASVGAVTGLHVVEHLPFEALIRLLDESLRVLKPGGVAMFETPNPENILVGACLFYNDPTHVHPLPPPLLQFLAQARGFSRVEVVGLTEHRPMPPRPEADANTTFGDLMCRPLDYAILAFKD
jgi:SAM-dependent methyltransferase